MSAETRPGVVRTTSPGATSCVGEDGSVCRQDHPRERGARAEPAVPQPEDETIYLASGKLLFEIQEGDQLVGKPLSPGDRSTSPPAPSIA